MKFQILPKNGSIKKFLDVARWICLPDSMRKLAIGSRASSIAKLLEAEFASDDNRGFCDEVHFFGVSVQYPLGEPR